MKFLPEFTYIIIIGIYSYVITRKIPKRFYSFSNIILALGAILFGVFFGVTPVNQGLDASTIIKGILYGVACSLPIITAILVITASDTFGVHFSKTPRESYNKKSFLYELLFRIPFGTALSEEIIFRGVLLGLLLQNHSLVTSIIISSILFGLWHIFPTLHTNKTHDPLIEYMDDQRRRNLIAVITAVIATTLTGAILAIINWRSGSLVSSWLIHTSINGFAILGGYIAVWYDHRKTSQQKTI